MYVLAQPLVEEAQIAELSRRHESCPEQKGGFFFVFQVHLVIMSGKVPSEDLLSHKVRGHRHG